MSRARTLADTVSTGSAVSATANDLSGGVIGAIPYQAGVGDTSMLSPGTSGHVLTSGGSGAAPTWASPTDTGYSNFVVFTSSGTWTCPAGITKALITVVGAGGGGGQSSGASGSGGTTSFVGPTTISASGGGGGNAATGGGTGGIGSSGDLNIRGSRGVSNGSGPFGNGGSSYYSGFTAYDAAGTLGGGGGGTITGGGGGGGGAAIKQFTTLTPGTAYTVTIGAGGSAGTSGFAGGAGVVTILY